MFRAMSWTRAPPVGPARRALVTTSDPWWRRPAIQQGDGGRSRCATATAGSWVSRAAREGEVDDSWDGGWEDALDSGEGLEDILLGPVHPYDRATNDQPAHQWGSRSGIVPRRFADPADLAIDEDSPSVEDLAFSDVDRRRRVPPGREQPTDRPKLPVHVRLGVRRGDAAAFRRLFEQAGRDLPRELTKRQRRAVRAERLGVTVEELARYQHVLSHPFSRDPEVGRMVLRVLGRPVPTVHEKRAAGHPGPGVGTIGGVATRSRAVTGGPSAGERGVRSTPGGARSAGAQERTSRSENGSAKKRARSRSRKGVGGSGRSSRLSRQARRAPSVPWCASCGGPISVNGLCGCS